MSAALGSATRLWKYPRTPYWPYSPAGPRDDDELADAARFAGRPIVITEKLDGSNTLLYQGEVYARSVSAPATGKWLAMVRKHHAWKVTEPDVFLYGSADIVPRDAPVGSRGARLREQGARGAVGPGRSTRGRGGPPCGWVPGCGFQAKRLQERSRGARTNRRALVEALAGMPHRTTVSETFARISIQVL